MRLNEIENKELPLLDLLRKINKPELIRHFYDNRIYRGLRNESRNYFIQSPEDRFKYNVLGVSKSGASLVDSLPSWNGYPSRRRSLICSTSLIEAEAYGYVYLVFPLDDTEIAMANSIDFVDSLYIPEVSGDWYELIGILLDEGILNKDGTINQVDDIINKELKTLIGNRSISAFLNEYLSPRKHGFKLYYELKNYSHQPNKEVWFESKSLLISHYWLFNDGGKYELEKYLNEII